MDWNDRINKQIIKKVTIDKDLIISIKKMADEKIESVDFIPSKNHNTIIVLLYDALREYLECHALSK